MKFIALFILCVFISSCSQIILKKAAAENASGIKVFLNKRVITGYSIFLIVTLIVTYLYRFVDLSTGALLDTLSYIFIFILSRCILNEKISREKIIGMVLILLGVIISVFF